MANLEKIFCAKCDKQMEQVLLPSYEFEEGIPLQNVESYKCFGCNRTFFTEKQSKKMEERTKKIKQNQFAFDKKISICGKSLAMGIPTELAQHINLKQGSRVKIFPLTKSSFKVIKI